MHIKAGAQSIKNSDRRYSAIRNALIAAVTSLALTLCAVPAGWAGGTGGQGGTDARGPGAGGAGSDGTQTNAHGAQGGTNSSAVPLAGPGVSGSNGDALLFSVNGGGGNSVTPPGLGGAGGTNDLNPIHGGAGGNYGLAVTAPGSITSSIPGNAGGNGSAGIGSAPQEGQGAGGGGGGDGVIFTASGILATHGVIAGGAGGAGGAAYGRYGSGGGGGGGGAGIVATSSAVLNVYNSVTGGVGGAGGDAVVHGLWGGGGGGGGVGLAATNSAINVESSGSISGGNGGTGGTGNWVGKAGKGATGILGSGLNVTAGGSISGGLSGNGTTRADAIHFLNGTNTLQLQKGYSITGNVVAGGTNDTLALGGSDNSTFNVSTIGSSAQYQGFEKFEKTGSSTWTLTGTGKQDWTINSSTLTADTNSLQGNVVNDGILNFSQTFSGTYSGVITGSGAVTVTGTGPFVMGGVTFATANSYTGGTTVDHNIMEVVGSGTLGSGGLVVKNSGSLAFFDGTSAAGRPITVESGGEIVFLGTSTTGAANVTVTGASSRILLQNDASADNATIKADNDAVVILTDATTARSANITLNNSSATFQNSSSVAGSTINETDASLTIRDNSVADGSAISLQGSTLDIGPRSALLALSIGSLNGDALSLVYLGASDLEVGSSNLDSNFSGVIQDAGGLMSATGGTFTKVGTGTFTLNGAIKYSGLTEIKAGRLIVGSDDAHSNAAIEGSVQVDAGATLGGHGSVGSLTVAGTVSPGNSIGTLTVHGDYTSEPGSTYDAEIDAAGNHDLIKVTGHVTLNGGSVNVQAANGNYVPSTNYTLLTAGGGVTGRYDSVTSSLAFLTPSLSYDPDDVILTLARNDTDFSAVAETRNQRAAATGAESLSWGNALYDSILGLDAQDARNAFDAVSGEIYASTQSALLEDSRYVRDAVSDRLSIGCIGAYGKNPNDVSCGHNVWARAYGDWGHTAGDGNAARLDHDTSGILIGADMGVHDWRVGALIGYNHGRSSVDARSSSSSNDSYAVGVYAGTRKGHLNLNVGAAYAWHDVDSSRTVAFTGYNDSVSGSYNANTAQLFGEVGYDVQRGRVTLTPFARAAYIHLDTDSFDESGGTAALRSAGTNTDLTVSTLGVRLSSVIKHAEATTVRAHGLVGWRHAFGSTTPEANLALDGGEQFTVSGVPVARDALAIEAGVDLQVKRNLSVGVDYVGQFGSGVQSNGIRLSLMRHF